MERLERRRRERLETIEFLAAEGLDVALMREEVNAIDAELRAYNDSARLSSGRGRRQAIEEDAGLQQAIALSEQQLAAEELLRAIPSNEFAQEVVELPAAVAGRIIGFHRANLDEIQATSGVRLTVPRPPSAGKRGGALDLRARGGLPRLRRRRCRRASPSYRGGEDSPRPHPRAGVFPRGVRGIRGARGARGSHTAARAELEPRPRRGGHARVAAEASIRADLRSASPAERGPEARGGDSGLRRASPVPAGRQIALDAQGDRKSQRGRRTGKRGFGGDCATSRIRSSSDTKYPGPCPVRCG
eukprot:SAG11_NODE_3677_length_2293_cov_3.032361_2_plen_302_part_00